MPVYLDRNATTTLDSRVLEAMMPHLTDASWQAFECASLWSRAAQVIFMNDGTQAGNFAIRGVAARRRASRWLKLAGNPRFGKKGK